MKKSLTDTTWRVACRGQASGRAVIVRTQDDLVRVQAGDVLVAKQTDMNYTPQMLMASAVITEDGGRYSHAAIFTRENGIPCMVGVDGIMSQIQDGDILEIDTETKTIKIKSVQMKEGQ